MKNQPNLQEKVREARTAKLVIEIAREAGFDIGFADLVKHQAQMVIGLSDTELEVFAGNEQVADFGCTVLTSFTTEVAAVGR